MWKYMAERRVGGRKGGHFWPKTKQNKYHHKNNATEVGSRAGD